MVQSAQWNPTMRKRKKQWECEENPPFSFILFLTTWSRVHNCISSVPSVFAWLYHQGGCLISFSGFSLSHFPLLVFSQVPLQECTAQSEYVYTGINTKTRVKHVLGEARICVCVCVLLHWSHLKTLSFLVRFDEVDWAAHGVQRTALCLCSDADAARVWRTDAVEADSFVSTGK